MPTRNRPAYPMKLRLQILGRIRRGKGAFSVSKETGIPLGTIEAWIRRMYGDVETLRKVEGRLTWPRR